MGPDYGYFLNPEAELASEEKNFRIEPPPLYSLQRKSRLRGAPPEGLETALRIAELKPQADSQQKIEYPSKKLAVQRLPLRLQIGLQPA
jgi:hypothetical protein